MSEEEREPEEQATRRPRVIDKRISARAATAAGAPEPAPTAPGPPEPPAPGAAGAPGPGAPGTGAAPEPTARPSVAPPQAHDPGGGPTEHLWTPEQEAEAHQMAREIADTPSLEWVVNTAVTLANVAATKLELGAAADAQLAIDTIAGILSAVGPRLQQAESPLRQTLAQLQLAYAQRLSPAAPESRTEGGT
ncbi:MAG: hypothetical protein M3P18_23080 [Actinomycetota bacterium]|nr:hypothetical protein [Actinomycetota bacterium]